MINWLARIDTEDVKDRREKKSFDSILLQAAFKVWFKWKTQSSGSWSLTSAMPWLGFLDCLPKIIQQHILSILSLPVKNVTKSWKFLISSSMGQWERLCWQDMGVPWWHKIPQGQGLLQSYSGKNSPCREPLWAPACACPQGAASSRYICSSTGQQHNLIYHLTRTKFPTLFLPFHYQCAPAPTSVSLFPQRHVDCFIEKIFPEVSVETPLWRQSMSNSNATFGVFFSCHCFSPGF